MTNKKHAVVTGGAGFIGSHLVHRLLREGYVVDVVDTFVAGRFEERIIDGASYHTIDVRDYSAVCGLVQSGSLVFHLAALPRIQDSIEKPRETFEVNVSGTAALLEAVRVCGAARLIFASSAAVYGESTALPLREDGPLAPVSPYGVHKLMGEQMLQLYRRQFEVSAHSLRFFNVYGPRMDPHGAYALVVGKFVEAYRRGAPIPIVGDGVATRDYIHVYDVVDALFRVATLSTVSAPAYNVSSGEETEVRALAAMCGDVFEYLPPRDEVLRSCGDATLAKRDLNWSTTVSLKEGVTELLKQAC